jgi:hypothetical protein
MNEMHGSRSKIPRKKSLPYIYIYDVKFLALLGARYIYDISKLRIKKGAGKRSHYSDLATSWKAGETGFDLQQKQRFFSLSPLPDHSCPQHGLLPGG